MDSINDIDAAGVDEVGRGPLAGPVVASCVLLDRNKPIEGLMDSKKLSPKKREYLASIIKEQALAYSLGRAEVAEIDSMNILKASLLAMKRAILALPVKPNKVFVDGNQIFACNIPLEAVIKGDSLIPAISAASIVAKVSRDQEMIALDEVYPEYGFKQHKGYPTKLHLEAIRQYGVTPIHRQSFAPVKAIVSQKLSESA